MIAYQSGHRQAFEDLYGCLAREVRGYLRATVREPGVADDLVQETFLEIHRSRRLYLPPLPVRPWVFGVARNVRLRHRRAAGRRARREQELSGGILERWSPQTAPGALEPRDVERALRDLPPGRREAWVLHHVHGFRFEEVAERLRIGVGAAKLRSSRAMTAVRVALGLPRRKRDD